MALGRKTEQSNAIGEGLCLKEGKNLGRVPLPLLGFEHIEIRIRNGVARRIKHHMCNKCFLSKKKRKEKKKETEPHSSEKINAHLPPFVHSHIQYLQTELHSSAIQTNAKA